MWQRFTQPAREAVLGAQILSAASRNSSVRPLHLFVATLQKADADSHLAALLLRAGLKAEEALLYAQAALEPDADCASNAEPLLTKSAKRVLEFAAHEARLAGDSYIGIEHLLLACLRPGLRDEPLSRAIAPLGWDLHVLRAYRRELKASFMQRRTMSHPLEALTGEAQKSIDAAYAAMRATFCGRISSAHLLLGLLSGDNRAVELLRESGASIDELKSQTRAAIRSDAILATPEKRFDSGAKRALDRAKLEAQGRGYNFIGADHLLLGLLPKRATIRERLTWGNGVKDEAARVLANVDGARLRALAGPPGQIRERPQPRAPRDVPAFYSVRAFLGACLFAFLVTYGLTFFPASPLPLIARLLTGGFFSLLIGSGLITCWMLLFSKATNLKSAWASAFFGALLGTIASLIVRG